jgi:hypothetical protein
MVHSRRAVARRIGLEVAYPVNPDTMGVRALAEVLIATQSAGQRSIAIHDSIFSIADMRPNLISLMGTGGFEALISHALTSARIEKPWLSEIRSKRDGTFDGLESAHSKLNAAEFHEGYVVLVTHLLQLLVQFLGPGVTREIVRKTWPHAPLGETSLGKEWDSDRSDNR